MKEWVGFLVQDEFILNLNSQCTIVILFLRCKVSPIFKDAYTLRTDNEKLEMAIPELSQLTQEC